MAPSAGAAQVAWAWVSLGQSAVAAEEALRRQGAREGLARQGLGPSPEARAERDPPVQDRASIRFRVDRAAQRHRFLEDRAVAVVVRFR